ncbi:MAG: hypothetical protein M1817_004240 [Caeruleum heppii]|nr:MAG: hypothetical protein M1817_004240 [Caeruleum heppii]
MDIRSTLGATNGITKRRQPDGLKMRFTPLGVRASRETNENLDTFRVPRGVATETASGGLSTKATNGTSGRKHKTPTDVESPRKKSKHKQMIIQDVIRKQPSPAAPEAMVPNGIAEPPRPRSPAPDDTEMGDDEADPRSGRSKERRRKREGRETSVERAIRKERKRKKQREANDAV